MRRKLQVLAGVVAALFMATIVVAVGPSSDPAGPSPVERIVDGFVWMVSSPQPEPQPQID